MAHHAVDSIDPPALAGAAQPLFSAPAVVRRIRRVGLGATTALGVMLLGRGADVTSLGLVGAIWAWLLALEVAGRLVWRDDQPRSWARVTVAIVCAMTAIITATGGVASALLVLYVPAGFTIGLSTPVATRWPGWLMPAAVALLVGAAAADPANAAVTLDWRVDGGGGLNLLEPVVIGVLAAACFHLGRQAGRTLASAQARALRAHRERAALAEQRHAEMLRAVGAVAHELKNPLTTTLSLVGHLHRKAPADSARHEALGVLLGEVRRIRGTVDGLLNAARPLGVDRLLPGQLSEVAEEAVASFRVLATAGDVELVLRARSGRARFDRRKLVQVIDNLLHNALEASGPGGRVVIAVGEQHQVAYLEVGDSGAGLAESMRARVGQWGATTKSEGSGIGLALSQAIVEQHGGTLTLHDIPDGGCRARIALPRATTGDEEA